MFLIDPDQSSWRQSHSPDSTRLHLVFSANIFMKIILMIGSSPAWIYSCYQIGNICCWNIWMQRSILFNSILKHSFLALLVYAKTFRFIASLLPTIFKYLNATRITIFYLSESRYFFLLFFPLTDGFLFSFTPSNGLHPHDISALLGMKWLNIMNVLNLAIRLILVLRIISTDFSFIKRGHH